MAQPKNDELLSVLKHLAIKADDTRDALSALDKKLDLHIQKTDYRFESIEKLDAEQNKLLAEHHQRSTELKKDNELREKELKARLAKLEEPRQWWNFTVKLAVTAGTLAGTAVAIIKLIKHL